jgi:hypothetical protein
MNCRKAKGWGVMTVVLFCSYNKLMYNVSLIGFLVCTYAAHIGQQARKKPLVTVILVDPSYVWGWRYEYDYDQLFSIGQVISALYSIAIQQLMTLLGDRRWLYRVPQRDQPTHFANNLPFCLSLYGRLQWGGGCLLLVWIEVVQQRLENGILTTRSGIGKPASGSQSEHGLFWDLVAGGPIRQKAKSQRNWRCPDFSAKNNFWLNRIRLSLGWCEHPQLFQERPLLWGGGGYIC